MLDIPEAAPAEAVTRSVVDLDALFAEKIAADESELEIVGVVKLFGVEWNLVTPANSFTILRGGRMDEDPAVIAEVLVGLVHEDQRSAFTRALGRVKVLKTEMLLAILNAMYEVIAERPTQPSTPSGRGRTARRSAKS